MAKFKTGDKVYHKATEQKGVIASLRHTDDGLVYEITWNDGEKSRHNEVELYSEKEWEDYNKPMSFRDE